MPTETVIVIAAIAVAFGIFGSVLAWADSQTRNLGKS
jgi:hypothetical protein